MQRFVGLLAVIVGLLIAGIHILAISGSTPIPVPGIVGIAFPVSILAAAAYIIIVQRNGHDLRRSPVWVFAAWAVVAIYASINFALADRATLGGHVETIDGAPTLVVHGQRVRALSHAGARAMEVWDVRAISGHMLPFLLIPGLALLYLVPSTRGTDIATRQSTER